MTDSTLPAYEPSRRCPKCAWSSCAKGVTYVRATGVGHRLGHHDSCGGYQMEHLCRVCECCGYTWAEAPVDATRVAPSPDQWTRTAGGS